MLSKIKILIIIIIILLILIIFRNINRSSPYNFIKDLVEKNTTIKIRSKNIKTCQKNNNKDMIVNNENMFSNKIASYGEVGLAESYIDGDWDSDNLEDTLYELILNYEIFTKEIQKKSIKFLFMSIKAYIKNKIQNNTKNSVRKNVSHHYDIGNDLFKKMLGKHMQYTCAYFYKPNMTLDEAQYAKMELIAKKLDLKPNMKVLDIGCGFGSMAYHLAKNYDVDVLGVTLSKEQISYGNKYFSHPKVTLEFKDYRDVQGEFDRVYSVGMFEHVGKKNYKEYYDKCYELLKSDGIMLIHSIGTNTRKWTHNCFINKYIFPEGELPHIENLTHSFIDKWHLEDFQNFGISYSKTLRAWYKNLGDWSGLERYNNKFRRLWKYYLLGCEAYFRTRIIFLFQIVYTKRNSNRNDDCHHIRNISI